MSYNPDAFCAYKTLDYFLSVYYRWSKDFLEAGKKRLMGDTMREANTDEVKELRGENSELKETVAELLLQNRIPEAVRTEVVDLALDYPEASARNLACMITEPAFNLQATASEFKDKTTGINQLWQTDFTYMKIVGWGWYYLATVLDDYSRFIVHWELCTTMTAADVKRTMDRALKKAKLSEGERPRLLSDNGPCYISEELKAYVQDRKIEHVRGRPDHPQTQGKIERYHRSMKNIIKLDNYYSPGELEERLKEFVHYYNYHRYHGSIQDLTPADVYYGRGEKILRQRKTTKIKTMKKRKQNYLFELMKTVP